MSLAGFRWMFAMCILTAIVESATTWDFENSTVGQIAPGFVVTEGKWIVTKVDAGQVLAQTAQNPNATFNLVLVNDTNARDVDISVEMKPIAGRLDQGGGIVWRAADAKNYYLARYNPLEDNYRLYHVVAGKRTLLKDTTLPHTAGMHTLRVTMTGDHIVCYYDGQAYLDHHDTQFSGSGKIGLWTKADAQTQFDNLTLRGQ